MAVSFNRPGVVVESFPSPVDSVFRTGVAGFVGPAVAGVPPATATLPLTALFTSWLDFADAFRDGPAWRRGTWRPDPVLWTSVRGFFLNGGTRCYVVLYDPAAADGPTGALDLAVAALADFDDVDLVCAPSLLGPYLQALRAPGAFAFRAPPALLAPRGRRGRAGPRGHARRGHLAAWRSGVSNRLRAGTRGAPRPSTSPPATLALLREPSGSRGFAGAAPGS